MSSSWDEKGETIEADETKATFTSTDCVTNIVVGGITALVLAVENNNLDIAKCLLSSKNSEDKVHVNCVWKSEEPTLRYNSPLLRAVELGNQQMADVLIEAGADVSGRNVIERGLPTETPLRLAVKNNDLAMCQLLIR